MPAMQRWASSPFIRYTIYLLSGITLYFQFKVILPFAIPVLIVISAFYLLIGFLPNRKSALFVKGITASIFLVYLGNLMTVRADASLLPNHLLNSDLTGGKYLSCRIISDPEIKGSKTRVFAEAIGFYKNKKWQICKGKIILYIKGKNKINYGDIILIPSKIDLLTPSLVPEAFSYKDFCADRQIYFQSYLDEKDATKTGEEINYFVYYSLKLRKYGEQILEKYIPGNENASLASALILGSRSGLSQDLKQAYTDTGTIHILAVSGLHVAIIYHLFLLLFGKSNATGKKRLLFAMAMLFALWLYAYITGLSPSVQRASMMFSLILVAQCFKRNGNIYNTIALSAFILLLIDPYYILDLGFLLSYLAVIGIVYLYPKIHALLDLKNKWLNQAWGLVAGCLAAQIFVLPVTLYFFHQFPVYFLLANLIIIPLSTVILYAGLAILVTSFLPFVPNLIGKLTSWLIFLLNKTALIIKELPFSTWNTYIDFEEYLLLSLFIISMLLLFANKKKKYLISSFCLLALIIFSMCYRAVSTFYSQEIFITSLQNQPLVGVRSNGCLILFSSVREADHMKKFERDLENYLLKYNVNSLAWHGLDESPESIMIENYFISFNRNTKSDIDRPHIYLLKSFIENDEKLCKTILDKTVYYWEKPIPQSIGINEKSLNLHSHYIKQHGPYFFKL